MATNSKYTGAQIESLLNQAQTKLSDAPKDTNSYARRNNAWVVVSAPFTATIVGDRHLIAYNGSGTQSYTFQFSHPDSAVTLKSLSVSGLGLSIAPGYSKAGFTITATDIVGDALGIVEAVFTVGGADYYTQMTVIASYQFYVNNNGYEYIDLGLPSGLLWATANVGASSTNAPGLYFMWGETEGNTVTGTVPDGGRAYNSAAYTALGLNTIQANLDLAHDAAHVHMGGDWRMPTKDEFAELVNNTSWTWGSIGGVNGRMFSNLSDPSKFIFFPVSGYCANSALSSNTAMYYWSSSLYDSSNKYYLYGTNSSVKADSYTYRHRGMPIRAVL